MADAAQPATYLLFHKRKTYSKYGTVVEPISGNKMLPSTKLYGQRRRPQSAPARPKPPGLTRHRGYAKPPGGRSSLQEHVNIWGPSFGNQNIGNGLRYKSEYRRQYYYKQVIEHP